MPKSDTDPEYNLRITDPRIRIQYLRIQNMEKTTRLYEAPDLGHGTKKLFAISRYIKTKYHIDTEFPWIHVA
jgi:hypothetical protein